MARELPEDLVPEILLRLPVKTLLRFRCVCKSWNNIITSSKFITTKAIMDRARRDGRVLVRFYYEETRHDSYALHSDNENIDKMMDIDFPFQFEDFIEFFYIIDCVDGVVCLMDSYQRTNTVLLWNPMIRKYLALPKPKYELSSNELIRTALGFGFDCVRNDYKYVRIYDYDSTMKMDMFKLSTSSWTDVVVPSFLPCVRSDVGKHLNGVLHWVTYDHSIVGFDLGSEVFRTMMLPKEIYRRNSSNLYDISIKVRCGLLCIFEKLRLPGTGKLCLWTMMEYGVHESWTKQFVIDWIGSLVSIRTNGHLIFNTSNDIDSGYVVAYDPYAQRTKPNVFHLETALIGLQMMQYTESLVLLNQGENTPVRDATTELC